MTPPDERTPATRLHRGLQLELLNALATAYPASIARLNDRVPADDDTIAANLLYLAEHGLVDSGIKMGRGLGFAFTESRITAKGLDFLADDGGLSAILGTVTIKLHADTLRELLVARVTSSDLPAAEKKSVIDHLRQLPEVALKEATTTLVKAGLDRLPDAVEWLRRLGGL